MDAWLVDLLVRTLRSIENLLLVVPHTDREKRIYALVVSALNLVDEDKENMGCAGRKEDNMLMLPVIFYTVEEQLPPKSSEEVYLGVVEEDDGRRTVLAVWHEGDGYWTDTGSVARHVRAWAEWPAVSEIG